MKNEIWKPIEGYEGLYEVSNLGRIRSLDRLDVYKGKYKRYFKGKMLNPTFYRGGYLQVQLSKNGKVKVCKLHRLVAQTFLPNPDNLPVVNHKDEDKTNNCVDNLEWCTQQYNINYGTRNERHKQKMIGRTGKKNHSSKPINQYTKEGKFVKYWESAGSVERVFGYRHENICKNLKGIYKSAYGYIWKYA